MSTITTFNRAACRIVRERLEAALSPVAEELGLTIEYGRGTFSEASFGLKVEFKCQTESGQPADFAGKARRIRLPEDCWGKEVRVGGRTIRIVGINLRRRKYPVSGTDVSTGRGYKFHADSIRLALAAA